MGRVAVLLPGQGAQRARMATALYGHDRVFTAAIDEVFDALGDDGALLRSDWLSSAPVVPIDHVTRSQPLLFAVNYAYARVALDWGLRPAALLGHSAGEVVAGVLADVFPVRDVARLVWERMARIASAAPGGMLAVSASQDEVTPHLLADVVVGAINAPRQVVLAGPAGPLADVAEALRAEHITCSPVASLTPFHSPALAGFVDVDQGVFTELGLKPPSTTIYSCYTGRVLADGEALSPSYWAVHPVAPVLFWPALDALLADGHDVLVQAGPGQGLAQLARRHPAVRDGRVRVVPMSSTVPGREIGALSSARAALEAAMANAMSE